MPCERDQLALNDGCEEIALGGSREASRRLYRSHYALAFSIDGGISSSSLSKRCADGRASDTWQKLDRTTALALGSLSDKIWTIAEILLFHHAQGQTSGFLAFADELRDAGHIVYSPDLYAGKTFANLDEGVGYAKQVGFDTIAERGRLSADGLPQALVYAGFSLGVMPAQMLAQTRPGAKGALFFSAAFPASEFGVPWPAHVPLQIHMMEDDEWALEDLPSARELTETVHDAALYLYPGDRHLFADSSLPDFDEDAATLLTQRVLEFLMAIG